MLRSHITKIEDALSCCDKQQRSCIHVQSATRYLKWKDKVLLFRFSFCVYMNYYYGVFPKFPIFSLSVVDEWRFVHLFKNCFKASKIIWERIILMCKKIRLLFFLTFRRRDKKMSQRVKVVNLLLRRFYVLKSHNITAVSFCQENKFAYSIDNGFQFNSDLNSKKDF